MSYAVRTQPAGHRFQVQPGQTILSAALEQGIGLPYGCRHGTCSSCSAFTTTVIVIFCLGGR